MAGGNHQRWSVPNGSVLAHKRTVHRSPFLNTDSCHESIRRGAHGGQDSVHASIIHTLC